MDIITLSNNYNLYKEKLLRKRRFKYTDFCQVINKHLDKENINFSEPEFSFEGRKIFVMTYGTGETKILIFSQMHGNEPVSTEALMDFLNFLETDKNWSKKVTLIIIPLLNPDGNEKFDRRNAQGIDINRDAMTLISPEARILMKIHERFSPDFALNLHDMEPHYTSKPENLQTVLAVLAPECDEKGSLNTARKRAVKVISGIITAIKPLIPNRLAKYTDKFTPEAFGDTFMQKGTASILLETGSIFNDKERIFARKVVFLSIVKAVDLIALKGYLHSPIGTYLKLPDNEKNNAFDLKIEKLSVKSNRGDYQLDIGIRRVKKTLNDEDFADEFSDYRIVNIGDLRRFGAIKSFDGSDYVFSGEYSEIFIGQKAAFEISSTKKNEIINIKSLL